MAWIHSLAHELPQAIGTAKKEKEKKKLKKKKEKVKCLESNINEWDKIVSFLCKNILAFSKTKANVS